MTTTPKIQGPVSFTYACGHPGILACVSAQQSDIAFASRGICATCRTLASLEAFGIKVQCPNTQEFTHFPCSVCGDLFQIEMLALQGDGGRICDSCVSDVEKVVAARRKLEAEGQVRLF